ncbi:MAG: DNA-binding protein [wastewater metagenome]|nr:DNA-binding protein [Candidatus Loosdrechtia aerotolerans]
MKKFSIVYGMLLIFTTVVSLQNIYAYSMKPVEPSKGDAKAQEDKPPLTGKIVETMSSGGYTYLHLEKDGKKIWAAVREMKVKVGDEISLEPGIEMTNFESKTLNRTFDKIIFSAGPVSSQYHTQHGYGFGDSKSLEVGAQENIKVEKAPGSNAYTVAELHAKRTELDQKSVALRGKVVKVSTGILQRNWIHIQDGTGNPDNGTHDIVVTSQDLPSLGDVVTVNGVLYKDKDFGSGYLYGVIIEEASVQK